MQDDDEYYDGEEDGDDVRSEDQNTRKIVYPPRLVVDFTAIGMPALRRYAQVYQLNVRDTYEPAELAAVVARHFDCSLDIEEDESILSFMSCVRNGAKAAVRHRPPERAKGDKKRTTKKSNSQSSQNRKRQRDSSVASRESSGSTNASAASTKTGESERRHASNGGGGNGAVASSSVSSSSSSARNHPSKPTKKTDGKKLKDNGEDNELYCICKRPSYGNMIACDGKDCRNPSQWYHLECVGFSDGQNPETWLCPECDPESFAELKSKKKKSKLRTTKSPGNK